MSRYTADDLSVEFKQAFDSVYSEQERHTYDREGHATATALAKHLYDVYGFGVRRPRSTRPYSTEEMTDLLQGLKALSYDEYWGWKPNADIPGWGVYKLIYGRHCTVKWSYAFFPRVLKAYNDIVGGTYFEVVKEPTVN